MDGFTVANANRFLETGHLPGENRIGSSSSSQSGMGIGATDGTQKSFADTLNDAIGSVNDL